MKESESEMIQVESTDSTHGNLLSDKTMNHDKAGRDNREPRMYGGKAVLF